MPYFRALKSYSYRNAPKKLIPAIIACKCVPYLVVLGFFICLCGLIPLFVRYETNEQIDEQIDEIPPTNQTLTAIIAESNNTIEDNNKRSTEHQDIDYIWYSCIGIGGVLLMSGIVCLIIAYCYFKDYEKDRIRHIQITDLDTDHPQSVITDPIIDGIGYPINIINKSKQCEYMPISQNNSNVYKSTTEPIVK